jgi:integrase
MSIITVKEIEALKPKEKPYMHRISQTKGKGTLAFKILPSGDKDAYFVYYIDRKEKLKKIGRYGDMSLKEINQRFDEFSVPYNKTGSDVKELERQQVKAKAEDDAKAEREAMRIKLQGSLQQLIDFYLEHTQETKSDSHYRSVKKVLNNLDIDRTIKANQVIKDDIIHCLHPVVDRGALVFANRIRAYLSAMFAYGIEFDDTTEALSKGVQFYIEDNPVVKVKKPLKEEAPRDRYLNKSEIFNVWRALDNSSMSLPRKNVFKLMLATGARLEALSGLQWTEIDQQSQTITIPPSRSKNGNYWVIPINKLAQSIIDETPRLSDHYVFPNDKGGIMRTDGFSQAITRLCQQYDIVHFQPRDLRTTFKTLAGAIGISKEIRDRIQNHALGDVSAKHYDRYEYIPEKRTALDKWGAHLEQIISGE